MTHPAEIDKYEIVRHLGGGQFGDVYHAIDRALQTEKAIKVLKASDPATFVDSLKEAQVLAECVHKHIVRINEANIFPVEGEERVVLDLEYIPEGSLDDALKGRFVTVREAVTSVRGALLGLEYAHSKGFLHRDIKPGNILLAPNCPKLSDFGLATELGSSMYGSGQGYVTHLAPEYFTTHRTSQQTDIFAAGLTLYRAVSNVRDWRARLASVPDVRQHVERGTLIKTMGFPGHVPPAVQKIILKACAPTTASRYADASTFGQKLDALRFNVDWLQVAEGEWRGRSGSDDFSAVITSRHQLVVKKNGRRLSACCQACGSRAEAISALVAHVAETTLA